MASRALLHVPGRAATGVAVFVTLSCLHSLVLITAPTALVVGILMWWNANTIAHNFIHRPFFRSRLANDLYSLHLSVTLGVPQRLWRARHLAHHADASGDGVNVASRCWRDPRLWMEVAVVATLWVVLVAKLPHYAATGYGPGIALGLILCWLHGRYEHAGGETTSHYGRLYNLLFFNDGYHVEHHARPGVAWDLLPARRARATRESRWPPILRWLEALSLDGLERLVIRSAVLQRLVVDRHARAFRVVLNQVGPVARITIVGGGLFPRTAIVLRRLLPTATLTIVDCETTHLDRARRWLDPDVQIQHRTFRPGDVEDADLVVIPLALRGDRQRLYERPAAPVMVCHDWLWNARHPGVVVSWLLLKRLTIVRL